MTLGALTVTVVRLGWDDSTRDRQNNPVVSELETFDLVGCFLQQLASDEDTPGRESAETRWVLFAPPLPAGKSMTRRDLVRVPAAAGHLTADEGQSYATLAQDGEPDQPEHIDGTVHHLELILKRAQL